MKRSTWASGRRRRGFERPAESCKSLTAIMPFVGRTREEALEKRDAANALVDPMVGLSSLLGALQCRFECTDLDAPVEQLQSTGTQSLIAMASRIARDNSLSLREIGRKYGESVLVPQLCGTPKQIADELADIFTSGDADGFRCLASLSAGFVCGVRGRCRAGTAAPRCIQAGYMASTLRGHLQT